jgi:hypothetical protein
MDVESAAYDGRKHIVPLAAFLQAFDAFFPKQVFPTVSSAPSAGSKFVYPNVIRGQLMGQKEPESVQSISGSFSSF